MSYKPDWIEFQERRSGERQKAIEKERASMEKSRCSPLPKTRDSTIFEVAEALRKQGVKVTVHTKQGGEGDE